MDKDGLKTDIEQEEIHCPFQFQQTVIQTMCYRTKLLTNYKAYSKAQTF